MSEESERGGSGPEGNGAGIDPAAVALVYAGKSSEAGAQFARAATPDLTPAEKSELKFMNREARS